MSQRFLKRTKDKCVTSTQQQPCFSQKEREKCIKFDKSKKGMSKCIDISKESENSMDALFTSNTSTQAEITVQNDKNSDYLSCRHMSENNTQLSSMMMSDDEAIFSSDHISEKSSKTRIKQVLLKNKIKRYKKCSCGSQCPYALYKLPCNKYKCSTLEKEKEYGTGELTLECSNFGEKYNFPKFLTIDTRREKNDKYFMDFGTDETSTTSLSVDLEVDVCSDYDNSENVDEFFKQKEASKTYMVNRINITRNDTLNHFETKTEFSSNIVLWKNTHIREKKKKINEIVGVSVNVLRER